MRLTITFDRIDIVEHRLEDDGYMAACLFYTIDDGTRSTDTWSDMKIPGGTDYGPGAIEVSYPANYRGPWSVSAFQREAEAYYFGIIRPSQGGETNGPSVVLKLGESIRVPTVLDENNEFAFTVLDSEIERRRVVTIEVAESGDAW